VIAFRKSPAVLITSYVIVVREAKTLAERRRVEDWLWSEGDKEVGFKARRIDVDVDLYNELNAQTEIGCGERLAQARLTAKRGDWRILWFDENALSVKLQDEVSGEGWRGRRWKMGR
jgi:hypothetical protein